MYKKRGSNLLKQIIYFLTMYSLLLSILTKSSHTLKCCFRVSVSSLSTSCRINTTSVERSICTIYETSGFSLDVVVRGCGLKRTCWNTLKGSGSVRYFEYYHVPVLKSIKQPSIECCIIVMHAVCWREKVLFRLFALF